MNKLPKSPGGGGGGDKKATSDSVLILLRNTPGLCIPICFHKKKPKYLVRCFFAQFSIVIWFLSVKPLEWKHYLELFSTALCYYNKG